MIQDRLKALRSEMAKRGISLYVVPTADFHESEYVGEHFNCLLYTSPSPRDRQKSRMPSSA